MRVRRAMAMDKKKLEELGAFGAGTPAGEVEPVPRYEAPTVRKAERASHV
ncbi:MAG: hypothetical protein GY866_00015 [Proteobacteria bacterium]|nr:hypothetical protein [Pseudomonadota bacterium]